MRVGELAKCFNVTPDTVRYYTRVGFLKPNRNGINGYKEYGKTDLQRLRFILSARQLGFTIEDITIILKEADHGKSPCPITRQLLETRLQETEQRFLEMVTLRDKMKSAVQQWQDKPDKTPSGHMICHLIEDFSFCKSEEETR